MQKFYLSLVCGVLLLVSSVLQTRLLLSEGKVENFPIVQLAVFAFGAVTLLGYAFVNRPRKKSS